MSLPHGLLGVFASLACGLALAQQLPPEVDAALARAKVPRDAVSLLVVDAEGKSPPRLSHRANVPVNPASVMKLVTTYAALELLGPAFSWSTPVFVEGAVRDGTLFGNLYIKGQGDPKLVIERLWLLLRRVQGLGIHKIAGDIVLDRSAFEAVDADPASFDGEPLRPYNAAPDALLLNFKSVVMTFVPDRTANTAQVHFEPPLAGVQMQTSVPLSNGVNGASAACGDYRAALKADFSDATRIRFGGTYPASCFEKVWSVAYADPRSYNVRAVEGLWREMGGQLAGTVRDGRVPALNGAARNPTLQPLLEPAFEIASPTLAEVIRDINKYSNNVMAQQLFLTLSLPVRGQNGSQTSVAATQEASREVLRRWWTDRIGSNDLPTLDNGSGLSRNERISAQALARLLQTAYRSPLMPELMSSLPISGVDGTLKRARAMPQGSAHLKTGSLRDVTAVAGYVHAASGKRYVLVAIANHPNANAARPAFETLVEWVALEN
ncbi:MAG: D-alanyl-D-alanine carboxypeptidase/D-alanyl-D-alanine-endopeptidase [Rhodoferax sp.]|uniref:D-alanyl-D-alanine carboxypeptidase/D-alanyl-D-alanine endopeptidase n=1 Tax=Rhodoferax sp. TaxID=50421 RepID=UPI00271D038A|nr:D-alanyl-D-alanine carboxypeptidase/D-alanyl-D-alanine-endopeptidase [Rhodoferax sp.]MDO8447230.1 D-alanyl-D-alanine carboxypeptidase/D-alanyl-D-alanine-endopeptidase [Rhodoferax sp.]